MKKEIYKIIKDFPNYSVSNYGNVKNNRTGYILKPVLQIKEKGYYVYAVNLNGRYRRIHQLVLRTFKPRIPRRNPDKTLLDKSHLQINHKDMNPLNNHLSNLEWCDHTFNQRQKKPVECIETGETFKSAYYAAKKYKINRQSICNAANPNLKTKTAAGLHWKYI